MTDTGESAAVRYRRDPFVVLEWEGGDAVLYDCDTLRRFRVDARLVSVLARLGGWASAGDLSAAGYDVSTAELERLAGLGIVEREGSHDAARSDACHWNAFDLAVHRQSNIGGYFAAEVRQRGEPPPAAFKPRASGPRTPLPGPADLAVPLDAVLRRRRTRRTYGEGPLGLDQLSALLHHSARVVGTGTDELLGEVAFRPFASGGARSELEIYVVSNDVADLAPGAHHYDGRAHDLALVQAADSHQERLNDRVSTATGGLLNRRPPAVLLITAVFDRVMWKYRQLALSIIYKNTGCLLQNLYLAATALNLAPCAVGGGEESANARWLGLDPLEESQVGCFLVGPGPGGA